MTSLDPGLVRELEPGILVPFQEIDQEMEIPIADYLGDIRNRTETQIARYVAEVGPGFGEIYEYAMRGPARRIRPALAYMTADMLDVPRDQVDRLALADELFHTGSITIDDLPGQDGSPIRRGREAVHIRFREGPTLLAGFGMVIEGQRIVGEVDAQNSLDGSLSSYYGGILGPNGMCLGQKQDLDTFSLHPADMTVAELDKIAYLKTGTAIEMSIVGVAILAKQPPTVIGLLKIFAYHAGLVFQIKNDLADGEKSGEDTINGRPNYLHVLGQQQANRKAVLHAYRAHRVLARLPLGYNPKRFDEITDLILQV